MQHWVYGPCPRTLRVIEFPDVCYFASSKPRTATRNVSAMVNSDHDRLSDHATSIRKRSLDTRIFSPHCNQSVSEMTYYCHKRANYSSSTNPRSTSDRRSTIEIDIGARRSAATIMSPAILRTIGIRILYTICLRTFRRDISTVVRMHRQCAHFGSGSFAGAAFYGGDYHTSSSQTPVRRSN